jgi:hypothetical protein
MNLPLIREFRLSSLPGIGIRCDAEGAFVGTVPLLKRSGSAWALRDESELSAALGGAYGLPIDIAARHDGIAAIARALNEGDLARAQIATLLLQFPDPPTLSKKALSQTEIVNLALMLDMAGVLKINTRHFPAKTPGGKGGQFAPKDADQSATQLDNQGGLDPTDLTNNLDSPTRDNPAAAAEQNLDRNAAAVSVEAAEESAEHQAVRTVSRQAIRDAALGAEEDVVRLTARRMFRAAALDALKNVGKKLVLTEIPIVGEIADISTVYDVYRFVGEFAELRSAIKVATRFVNEGAHTLRDLRVSRKFESFNNYDEFLKLSGSAWDKILEKRFGSAGPGSQYHHIIEQSAGVSKQITETTENIVKIPRILHEAVNGRYMQAVSATNKTTLRNWLRTQPIAVQREWGIKVLKEFGIIIGE